MSACDESSRTFHSGSTVATATVSLPLEHQILRNKSVFRCEVGGQREVVCLFVYWLRVGCIWTHWLARKYLAIVRRVILSTFDKTSWPHPIFPFHVFLYNINISLPDVLCTTLIFNLECFQDQYFMWKWCQLGLWCPGQQNGWWLCNLVGKMATSSPASC